MRHILLVVLMSVGGLLACQPRGDLRQQAHVLVETEHGLLLDVRSQEEFAEGHVQGAVNIPVQDLPRRLSEVGSKDRPVVVYCAAGPRASRATRLLTDAGFTRVLDLGAMSNW